LYNNSSNSISNLYISETNLSSIDISNLQNLQEFGAANIANSSFIIISNSLTFTKLFNFAVINSYQNQTKIDNILNSFASNSPLNTGNINLSGTSNGIPGPIGLAAIAALQTSPKNWFIYYNS
jgi:hypothetical protein